MNINPDYPLIILVEGPIGVGKTSVTQEFEKINQTYQKLGIETAQTLQAKSIEDTFKGDVIEGAANFLQDVVYKVHSEPILGQKLGLKKLLREYYLPDTEESQKNACFKLQTAIQLAMMQEPPPLLKDGIQTEIPILDSGLTSEKVFREVLTSRKHQYITEEDNEILEAQYQLFMNNYLTKCNLLIINLTASTKTLMQRIANRNRIEEKYLTDSFINDLRKQFLAKEHHRDFNIETQGRTMVLNCNTETQSVETIVLEIQLYKERYFDSLTEEEEDRDD